MVRIRFPPAGSLVANCQGCRPPPSRMRSRRANPSHMICAVTEVKNVVDQSGPAGASPTLFRPADRIERLTSEPSNARLHSNKRT